ncbi:MAG: HEAT repeat domain-containing protein, partial [Planctomycetes bacterium]|nr:HEAT repeat domain-containing protein [Planctomycetota bacterium]
MKTVLFIIAVIAAIGVAVFLAFGPIGTSPAPNGEPGAVSESAGGGGEALPDASGFVGSSPCRDCHEDFYELWAPSLHGLAMQPFTPQFAQNEIEPQDDFLEIGPNRFRVELKGGKGWVLQEGPEGKGRYEILHVLGGKNVYYFLAPMDRGHLQVLPLAFDVRQREWFDTAGSAVRHFPDMTDEALDWKDRPYTFNTSCFNCHVSQLEVNYTLDDDSYHTVWAEPGINCETCHGPASEHIRVCQAAAETDSVPEDLKIIIVKDFDIPQTNTLCAPCHAKMAPLTDSFMPGDRYFDHYDLFMLEDSDFYPDGRDLGENYTFTLWRMNPCANSGEMSCSHCHTSSGRTRFMEDESDDACLPCHVEHVENPADHSHHPAESEGSRCYACHMPKTTFARMERHDHTLLAPTPATTIAYDSPNACNICHEDEDAEWSNEWVGKWYRKDYQKPILYRAGLLDAARKRDWSRLDDILAYITSDDRDEVFAASLIRLLEGCPLEKKWPAIIETLQDESPLIRSSAARALGGNLTEQAVKALLEATSDDYRVVRVHAGASLAPYPQQLLGAEDQERLQKALGEYEASLKRRPDHATSHYNLGNFY